MILNKNKNLINKKLQNNAVSRNNINGYAANDGTGSDLAGPYYEHAPGK